jgi:hypothetical protein
MKQEQRNSDNFRQSTFGGLANGLFGRLAAEKKKTTCAVGLIMLMLFMWAKVFWKKGPQSAEASPANQPVAVGKAEPQLKISFIKLPKIAGRNDVLARDFFVIDGTVLRGAGEVSVVSKGGSEEAVRQIAEKLKLEAIVTGSVPQAFINDKLLSVGDKLLVGNAEQSCECEVAAVEENRVLMRCREAEITLKLTQTSVIDY